MLGGVHVSADNSALLGWVWVLAESSLMCSDSDVSTEGVRSGGRHVLDRSPGKDQIQLLLAYLLPMHLF